jgi:hypothetical protein
LTETGCAKERAESHYHIRKLIIRRFT